MIRTPAPAFFSFLRAGMAIFALCLCIPCAQGETITIDSFSDDPNSAFPFVFPAGLTSQSLPGSRTDGDIIGGQSDLMLFVEGTSMPTSLAAAVSNGGFMFASSNPGGSLTLLYDGDGEEMLDLDLSDFVEEGLFVIDFFFLDAGPISSQIQVDVTLTSAQGTSVLTDTIEESATGFEFAASLDSFDTSDGFSYADVDSIEVVFNDQNDIAVDFAIDEIRFFIEETPVDSDSTPTAAETPEPATWILAVLAGLPALMTRWRRGRA